MLNCPLSNFEEIKGSTHMRNLLRKTFIKLVNRCAICSLFVLFMMGYSQLLAADSPRWQGSFEQGGLVLGKVPSQYRVIYQGKVLKLSSQGYFLLGFGRNASKTVELTVVDNNAQKHRQTLNLNQRVYNTQRVEGVPQETVTPSEKDLKRIRNDARMVASARGKITDDIYFLDGFMPPLTGPITGVYGSQRIYNGIPKRPHYGIDYAAPTGTLVRAPAGGVVIFAHRDLFYSGGTLIIDHGHGLSSTFLHLSDIYLELGQRVERGEPIAEVGASGRATGPHLDWRMNWQKERIDPQLVLKALPAK